MATKITLVFRAAMFAAWFVAVILAGSLVYAAPTNETRPTWCRPQFECIPTAEIVKDAEEHYDLREQILRYKRRAQRFGLTVGPGIGVGSVVDSDFNVHWVGTVGVFVVAGIRF